MKRLLVGFGLTLAAVICLAAPSSADFSNGSMAVVKLKWITSLAASPSVWIDSLTFSEAGSANATRDTSEWVDVSSALPWSPGLASLSDSTLAIGFSIRGVNTSTITSAGDSLYAYIQATNDPALIPEAGIAATNSNAYTNTNLNEILSSDNATTAIVTSFDFPITQARWALNLNKFQFVRIIVRGDLNGIFDGKVRFYRSAVASEGER